MPLYRQMDRFELSRWCLWMMTTFFQMLLITITVLYGWDSLQAWAATACAVGVALAAIAFWMFDQSDTRSERLMNFAFIGVMPLMTTILLAVDGFGILVPGMHAGLLNSVPWAFFQSLLLVLMVGYVVYDRVYLPSEPITVDFRDIATDAHANAADPA